MGWLVFGVLVVALLVVDLAVFHRRAHTVSVREALVSSAVWVAVGLAFGGFVWWHRGEEAALAYYTGYLVEKSLSVDNLFVFVVIFGAFAVPREQQHRVLFWGIIGALVLRAMFILAGAALLARFHVLLYGFGTLLVWTAVRLLIVRDAAPDPARNPIFRIVRRIVPSTPEYHGGRFVVARRATPLLLALLAIEATDVVFAVDSVPAIFGITEDPFIVYTSNIFAMLGLRSLYFLLAGVLDRLRYLKLGLALILAFVGVKMLLAKVIEVPVAVSLGIILAILGVSVAASLVSQRRSRARPGSAAEPLAHSKDRSDPTPAR